MLTFKLEPGLLLNDVFFLQNSVNTVTERGLALLPSSYDQQELENAVSDFHFQDQTHSSCLESSYTSLFVIADTRRSRSYITLTSSVAALQAAVECHTQSVVMGGTKPL